MLIAKLYFCLTYIRLQELFLEDSKGNFLKTTGKNSKIIFEVQIILDETLDFIMHFQI